MTQITRLSLQGIPGRVQTFLAKAGAPSYATRAFGTAVRVLVFDRGGTMLAELQPELGRVTWRLNDVSRITFRLRKNDPKATQANLQYGNRLLIQFSNGLPDWGGVIDPPRDWSGAGLVGVTAYSGAYLLGWRQTDRGRYFDKETAGGIFRRVISESGLGIQIGEVWTGGGVHSPSYHFEDYLTIVRDSICERLESCDFEITPELESQELVFYAHLREVQGSTKPYTRLIEGHNLTDNIRLLEQGTIVNSWDMAGDGTTWGDDRLITHQEDLTSIGEYDLRQGSAVQVGVTAQSTLDQTARIKLAESKDPHVMLELEALDTAPARFVEYGVGDTVRVLLPSFGFGGYDAQVRILAREYDPARGTCKLVVRET